MLKVNHKLYPFKCLDNSTAYIIQKIYVWVLTKQTELLLYLSWQVRIEF